jgi:hypothetical protein
MPIQAKFFDQAANTQMEVLPGVERRMRWSVPDGLRDEQGELLHDDLVMSAALCAVLDEQEWMMTGAPVVVRRGDPLAELDNKGW